MYGDISPLEYGANLFSISGGTNVSLKRWIAEISWDISIYILYVLNYYT